MPMLTHTQVSERLQMHPKTVARLAADRGVGSKLGREWRFHEGEINALLQPVVRKPKPAPKNKKDPKCPSKSTRRANRGGITASGGLSEESPLMKAQAQIFALRQRN